MGRKVRAGDAKLMSRTARETLRRSRKPYYRPIERGIALGYRKPKKGPGTWLVRRYVGDDNYTVRNLITKDGHAIFADDFESANGKTILDFGQAQDIIRQHKNELTGNTGPYPVADAMNDYFRFLKSDGRSEHAIRDAHCRANALILPKLGTVKITALTSDRLRRWRDELVNTAPRLRTRQGDDQKYRRVNGEDAHARPSGIRKSNMDDSSCRAQSQLHTMARSLPIRRGGKSDHSKVSAARIRYLTVAEASGWLTAAILNFVRLCKPRCKPDAATAN